jgi:hypothetical protein
MWYFDGSIPSELKEAIEQAGPPLVLSDAAMEQQGVRPVDVKRWCQKNLSSFIWMDEQDVSDVSLQWDYVYAFYIFKQEDRNWFSLRWGT